MGKAQRLTLSHKRLKYSQSQKGSIKVRLNGNGENPITWVLGLRYSLDLIEILRD